MSVMNNYKMKRIEVFLILTVLVVVTFIGVNNVLFSRISKSSQYLKTNGSSVVPFLSSVSQDFQLIGNGSIKSYGYSAYFHKQGVTGQEGKSVIVVSGLSKNSTLDYFCQLYNKHQELISSIKGVLKPLKVDNTQWQMPYHPYYIICQCNTSDVIPSFVSVVESEQSQKNTKNLLRIAYNTEQKYNFSMCVQPFYNYEKPFQFVEWIEYYILMGVEKFTFYNTSIGPKTSCLMKSYGNAVEILPFSLPYEFHKEIYLGGQSISNNECVQRYRGLSKYLIIADTDEMIMPASPSKGNKFNEMMGHINNYMAKLNNYRSSEISVYRFLNRFFMLDWILPLDENLTSPLEVLGLPNSERVLQHLLMSTKLLKETEPDDWRTKCIVNPDLVVEMGVHHVQESMGGTQDVLVPEQLAYIHHYRNCTNSVSFVVNCKTKGREIDNSAQRFVKEVANRVSQRLFQLAKHCNLDVDS